MDTSLGHSRPSLDTDLPYNLHLNLVLNNRLGFGSHHKKDKRFLLLHFDKFFKNNVNRYATCSVKSLKVSFVSHLSACIYHNLFT